MPLFWTYYFSLSLINEFYYLQILNKLTKHYFEMTSFLNCNQQVLRWPNNVWAISIQPKILSSQLSCGVKNPFNCYIQTLAHII